MASFRLLPRALSDSTFLRVYVLLALALVMSFALALLAITVVDKVRRQHYQEQLAEAPMTLFSARLEALPAERRDAWLREQSARLGIRLSLHEMTDYPLGYFERARLEGGQTLVRQTETMGWLLHRRLDDEPRLLRLELASLGEHQLVGLARQLGQWLVEVPPERRAARLDRLRSGVIQLSLTDTPPEGLDPTRLASLSDAEVVVRLLPQRWAMSLYLQLPVASGGTQWVEVGPLNAFEPLPASLLLLLLLMLLGMLAVIIYLIVRGVEARMARLELAATRIAAGRLDTRVKVEGNDFLSRLGMALNGMATQVQSLLRGQQDMIRAVSHELRTPVARIRFAVQMVEDMTDEPGVRRHLQGIDADITELDDLVDEILTYARLGSETANGVPMETSLVECRAMAERVIEALHPLHAQLSLSLVPGEEVEAAAESRYLQRALQNLVANACRHARARVLIRIHGEPRLVRIDIEDDGPGVPVAKRSEIFKPFARLDDSRARNSGGYGLGLSIVQKVMAWHGGSVMVDASPSLGGARFTLLLPQRAAGHDA
ncbi:MULTISPECIES: ATP-binding protein [Halomonas]|uniref:histidine kinase n=1 Tax=Halomonas halophila TaxID=29573 RepID=A0ABQ0U3L2_9GAMM|nr:MULTISPECIES: ATP-binding protein [Halomonas]MDR5888500.1 ATP-binding protein [Halomonas salina]WJY07683.1 ATP-binding protein [Halomonas halophila]GEK73032.1 two-component sensor histidine kinase [Halomonas halophila]